MTPEQIRAMYAQQRGNHSPPSSNFFSSNNKGNLNQSSTVTNEKMKHLHKFANLAKKGLGHSKSLAEKANQKRIEKQYEKTAKLHTINNSVNEIMASDDSDGEKTAKLQRLLSTNHKDIDHALMSRIQLEMKLLHNSNTESNPHTDHAERLQNENNGRTNEPFIPFKTPFTGNPKKKVGYDPQTEQDIFDDGSRSDPPDFDMNDYNQSDKPNAHRESFNAEIESELNK